MVRDEILDTRVGKSISSRRNPASSFQKLLSEFEAGSRLLEMDFQKLEAGFWK